MLLRLLGTKTPKCTQITLYVNSKQQYQKQLFSSYILLGTNPPKYIQITLSGVRRRHSQKCVNRVFFEDIRHQTVKSKKNIHYKKSKLYFFFFKFLTYQNAKTRVKNPLQTNWTTLPKTYDLCVFQIVRFKYLNAKMNDLICL